MTVSLLAHAQIVGANGGTSSPLDCTGATLLVVCLSWFWTVTQPVVTDSLGNVWTTRINQLSTAGNSRTAIVTSDTSPTAGAAQTFTVSGTGAFITAEVLAFNGTVSGSYVSSVGAFGSSTAPAAGSIAPPNPPSVFVTSLTRETGASSYSIDSGFAISDSDNGAPAVNFGGAAAWLANLSGSAVAPVWTMTPTGPWGAAMALFRANASAGVSQLPTLGVG